MPRPYFKSKSSKIDEIIRVDLAGEFGAQKIYQGQIDFTPEGAERQKMIEMKNQEEKHLSFFIEETQQRNTRPSVLLGIWGGCAYTLGAASAIAGSAVAMQVTESVEDVIEKHYAQQIDYLKDHENQEKLHKTITKFRQEEIEHQHIAGDFNHKPSLATICTDFIVKKICKAAIALSKKY